MEKSKLYNPQYNNLPHKELEALLLSLPEYDRRFVFLRFESFERFGMVTDTAIYKYDDAEFVFVPGNEVTLGWNDFAVGFDETTASNIKEAFQELDMPFDELDSFLQAQMSPVRRVTISPLLVERVPNDIGWRNVALDSPELKPFEDRMKSFFQKGFGSFTLEKRMRINQKNGESVADIYESISLDDFLAQIHQSGFSLPTEDEWEYLCGGGTRTLFRWGDSFDYEMKLRYFSNNFAKDTPYTLEEPNQFGLSIAYDPYKYEVVENSEYFLKGGDGGYAICGDYGMTLGYLPVATYFRSYSLSNDELGYQYDIGDDTFFRRLIRL